MTINKLLCCIIAGVSVAASASAKPQTISLRVTNYHATVRECGSSRGRTAAGVRVYSKYIGPSGRPAHVGVCAADWKHFPPATIIHIPNTREFLVVADTGGKVKGGRHIDRYRSTNDNKPYPTVSRGYVVSRGSYGARGARHVRVSAALREAHRLADRLVLNETVNLTFFVVDRLGITKLVPAWNNKCGYYTYPDLVSGTHSSPRKDNFVYKIIQVPSRLTKNALSGGKSNER